MQLWRLLILTACISGCASTPISPLAGSPESITISAGYGLEEYHVTITDADEIERIIGLIRKVRGYIYSSVNFDIAEVKVVHIRISHRHASTEITLVDGLVKVPGNDQGLFYGRNWEIQSELWQLALTHLGVADDQSKTAQRDAAK